jgi:hypothetical protein
VSVELWVLLIDALPFCTFFFKCWTRQTHTHTNTHKVVAGQAARRLGWPCGPAQGFPNPSSTWTTVEPPLPSLKPLLTVDGLVGCAIHTAIPVDLQVVAVSGCGRVQVGQATPAGAQQWGGIRVGSGDAGAAGAAQGTDQEPEAGPPHCAALCSLNG